MTVRSCLALASLAATLAATSAPAQEELIDRSVVRNRLHSPAGRLELSGSVGLTLVTYLTDHYTFDAGIAYNLFNTLALEVRGGYALSRHTALARTLSEKFLNRQDVVRTDELEDLWEMNAHGVAGVRWAPIYGKLSLFSDVATHFQTYLWLGGGLGSLQRESVIQCTQVVEAERGLGLCDNRDRGDPGDRSTATENYWQKESRVAPVVSGALGFRFFLGSHHGVRLEVRDWAFRDRYNVGVERAAWEAGEDTGTPASNPGLTHLVQFDLGYTFLF